MSRAANALPSRGVLFTCKGLPFILAALAGLLALSGCRLLEVKFPGEPLSKQDAQVRFQTREFATTFAATIAKAADEIATPAARRDHRRLAGEWKVGAVGAVRRATLRSAPILALVDCWALCRQMTALVEREGSAYFGAGQPKALAAAKTLEAQLEAIARDTLPGAEFNQARTFVAEYAGKFPVTDLAFNREPVTVHWEAFTGKPTSPPGGTTADVLNDFSDRLQVLSEQMPSEMGWRVSLQTEGLEATLAEARQALISLDQAVKRISDFTASTPATISNLVHEFEGAFVPALERLEQEWAASVDAQRKAIIHDLTSISPSTISNAVLELGGAFLPALSRERGALTKDLSAEREALVKAVDQQRAAIMKEVESMAVQVTDRSMTHLRGTVRDGLFYLVVLAAILLGLPFFFGYLVGRVLGRNGNADAQPRSVLASK